MGKNIIRFRFIQQLTCCGILFLSFATKAQTIIDPCFTSPTVGTSFASTANVHDNNSDLLNWGGASWTGGWGGAAITLAPPGSVPGTRAIWMGDGLVWTTGGEGFGLRLNSGLVTGTTYSYTYTRVSHGTGSGGAFSPRLYTNSGGSFGYNVAAIPTAGSAWFTGVISFTAVAAQSGHTWIYFHSASTGGGSGMFLACESIVLPMQLWDFRGWKDDEKNILSWKADDEEEYTSHIVEKSADGETFEEVGQLLIHSAGQKNEYTFADKNQGEASVFYRIRSLNLNGESAYSPVIRIGSGFSDDQVLSIYPNPLQPAETIHLDILSNRSQVVWLSLSDLSGKLIQRESRNVEAGIHSLELNGENLAAGAYLLRVQGETFSRAVQLFVREE